MQNENVKISIYSIIFNLLLSVFKFIFGFIGHSKTIIVDGIHSLSDVLSTIIIIIGFFISNKDNDDEHPYGHERFECVASIILSILLFVTSILLFDKSILGIINHSSNDIKPDVSTIIIALISIFVKELMFQYTMFFAKKNNSISLKADAWHHRSDALSSIVALVSIILARYGFFIFDQIGSIIICIFIFKVAFDIFKESINMMLDKSCDKIFEDELKNIINKYDDVKHIDLLKTRQFANKAYVDIEIAVDKNMSVYDSHKIAELIHNEIEDSFKNVKHCMIHINPF